VVETWDNPTGFDLQIQCGAVVEVCDNNVDDDQDGDTDCDDADCSLNPLCQPSACEIAQTISCGDQVSGNTQNGVMRFDRYSCLRQGSEDGPEVAYQLDVSPGTSITVGMQHGDGSDLDLLLLPGSCDPDACLDASLNYSRPESLEFVMPADGAFLVVETFENPTTFDLTVSCAVPDEVCDNSVDDDLDGDTDCDDADCTTDPACVPDEICDNSADDDLDGDTDCDDADCAGDPACVPDEICDNSTDDDLDGDTDCDDADCAGDPACVPDEDCDNSVDDDLDGDTDCDDGDCEGDGACLVEDCGNSVDDDLDGDTDCEDADCGEDEVCEGKSHGGCGCGGNNDGVLGGLILLAAFTAIFRARARSC
jgi:hypothetical protein